jgi:hypothetical protein
MIVQWCVKGISLPNKAAAAQILAKQDGLMCNWWRRVHRISPHEVRHKLTANNVDMHVNHFTDKDPATGLPFNEESPFISMSAGTVERDAVARTNYVHRARKTALYFGTQFGRLPTAYLFVCWLILAPRPSADIETVAEEVRDLNSYRHYSPFQTEGEVLAKIHVPDNHIQCCEQWDFEPAANLYRCTDVIPNPRFTSPEQLSNVRELI